MKYNDLVESLKQNKDIKDLPRYLAEHVFPVLDKKNDQTVERALELLEVKYGRSRTERIEELVDDLLNFWEDQYEDDGELLLAMKDIRRREKEKKITRDEWLVTWMLGRIKKRKRVDPHEIQTLRNVVKKGGEKVVENFEEVFKEVNIEGKR